jgi:hypothetical protein
LFQVGKYKGNIKGGEKSKRVDKISEKYKKNIIFLGIIHLKQISIYRVFYLDLLIFFRITPRQFYTWKRVFLNCYNFLFQLGR